jgi:hypothetical protein
VSSTTGRKREKSSSSPCIKFAFGGPCIGGAVGKAGHTVAKGLSKVPGHSQFGIEDQTKRSANRDHRKR